MARILVVEDSASMRRLIVTTLVDAGHEVVEAADGRAGCDAARGNAVDMVITDINMPLMDGLSMIAELRRLPAHRYTPILVLTTESDAGRRAEAKSAGASGWLVKPFEPNKLVGAVSRLAG